MAEYIEWEKWFKLGHTISVMNPVTFECLSQPWTVMFNIHTVSHNVVLNVGFNIAPMYFDKAMEKIERNNWKYYTYKRYNGAVKLLGNK